jgi:Outer membrane protein beta-barrel domain
MKRLAIVLGLLIGVTTTAAAADSGGFGLGIGMVKVKDSDTSNLWLTANLRTMLATNVALEPEVGWYHNSLGDFHAFNGGGSLLIVFPTRKVDVFAGAGLGAHMFRYSGGNGNTTKLGYHGLAGADLLASDGISLFGAVRYEVIKFDSVNVKQWKLYGGLRFRSH